MAPGIFSAGADLKERKDIPPEEVGPFRDERTRTRIERTLVFVRVRPNMNEHEHGFFKNY